MPHLGEARALLDVTTSLLGDGAIARFEHPSNSVLQSAQYAGGGRGIAMVRAVMTEVEDCTAPDEIDRIIQQYRDLNRSPIPARTDFVREHSSEHFDESELNTGDYSYFIPGVMSEIAEAVRTRYNGKVDTDAATDYGIVVSSGYRNPRRDDQVGGVSTSKHQWGEAVDLVPGRLPPNVTSSQAMDWIEEAAQDAGYEVEDEGDHVHVEVPDEAP